MLFKNDEYAEMIGRLFSKEFFEKLSDYEHDRWSRWHKYMMSKCITNTDGSVTIPSEFVNRWNRQSVTHYDDLTEIEKDSDRKEASTIVQDLIFSALFQDEIYYMNHESDNH